MLRVGLTGGIGAGKSTVARRLVELGATVVDADQVAREVVLPGTDGLARVVEAFGERVLDAEGGLDRPALAEIVFGDESARRRLNGILHPLIGERTAELIAAAPADGVLVQDVPLIVEGAMQSAFPLVVVVDAAEDMRVARLIADRGMTEAAARARIAAQAGEPARRAAADVWLDNSGRPGDLLAAVDRLWTERLVPFEAALRSGAPASLPAAVVDAVVDAVAEVDSERPAQFERLAARVRRAVPGGESEIRVDHVGPTSVPGLPAPDVIDLQLGLPGLDDLEPALPALREVGFLPGSGASARMWPEGQSGPMLLSVDPGRPARLHVRVLGSAEHRVALLLRDWLRADPRGRAEYSAAAQRCREERADQVEHPDSGHRWAGASLDQANRWAMRSGWRAPAGGAGTDSTQKV